MPSSLYPVDSIIFCMLGNLGTLFVSGWVEQSSLFLLVQNLVCSVVYVRLISLWLAGVADGSAWLGWLVTGPGRR
ncbi:hypothetical protein B0T25DRAFT_540048 [Lasiosphaeria hispida]|uniref:Uncharacterized protein n=1 Tax=Lasiosphaeria hispida TaxID=260671 RepID=A0AAJ0HN07_9PEZI|nr:hypothetical protein B0T25DRAFT_540048 [Lasiosphaeria hispida]